MKTIQKTCSLFGLDPERPPPVPPSRPYTVTGNRKIAYPQSRVMKNAFPGLLTSLFIYLREMKMVSIAKEAQEGLIPQHGEILPHRRRKWSGGGS